MAKGIIILLFSLVCCNSPPLFRVELVSERGNEEIDGAILLRRLARFGIQAEIPLMMKHRIILNIKGENGPLYLQTVCRRGTLSFYMVSEKGEEEGRLERDFNVWNCNNIEILEKKMPKGKTLRCVCEKGECVPLVLENPPIITNREIKKVKVDHHSDGSETRILLEFTPYGSKLIEEISTRYFGRRLALVLDGEILTMALIKEKIVGGMVAVTIPSRWLDEPNKERITTLLYSLETGDELTDYWTIKELVRQ